ncbi:TadE/TadG family type IV pilus assembly protein [Aurantiacibacter sp. D1-12]|uniref:TadE/TadG family type IV pilus assembly protein n=1 Tax=Aurantiacibacter sp. D1-12 TaxID=2993658 RepID=UPI00237CD849|nr:TadE/TadG family type IV pilus assembly protein [Aurantiacibacter sp. D1-12]MDE1467683.1 pilus assembly protein [Aurantiacibacter sp. D1-12]
MITAYLSEARRIWRDEGGVAFVEFAFVAPILLLLILGGLELANYALAHMRVNQIAMTVADNAGRVNTGIDEANVQEVFAGAGVIGAPLDFEEHGRIVLSSLQHNGRNGRNEGQMINWQRCWGELDRDPAYGVEGDGRNDNSLEDGMGPDGKRIISAEGTAVMVAEVYYTYQPLIDTGYMVINETIAHESAFNVRGRENNDLTNAQNLDEMTCGS